MTPHVWMLLTFCGTMMLCPYVPKHWRVVEMCSVPHVCVFLPDAPGAQAVAALSCCFALELYTNAQKCGSRSSVTDHDYVIRLDGFAPLPREGT